MPGRKNSSKKRKIAVASTVSPIDPKEQLRTEMRSLGYVEGLFIVYHYPCEKIAVASLQFNIRVFLLCRFDGDIFTRNLEASVEGNMLGGGGGGGGGARERGGRTSKNSINRLLYLDLCATHLCGFGKRFSLSFIGTFFFFFLGPVFFLVF